MGISIFEMIIVIVLLLSIITMLALIIRILYSFVHKEKYEPQDKDVVEANDLAELYKTRDGKYSYKVYNENKRRLLEQRRGEIDLDKEFGISSRKEKR